MRVATLTIVLIVASFLGAHAVELLRAHEDEVGERAAKVKAVVTVLPGPVKPPKTPKPPKTYKLEIRVIPLDYSCWGDFEIKTGSWPFKTWKSLTCRWGRYYGTWYVSEASAGSLMKVRHRGNTEACKKSAAGFYLEKQGRTEGCVQLARKVWVGPFLRCKTRERYDFEIRARFKGKQYNVNVKDSSEIQCPKSHNSYSRPCRKICRCRDYCVRSQGSIAVCNARCGVPATCKAVCKVN